MVSIAVSPGNPELPVGVPGQFTATGTFADGSTRDITRFVTWASATPSVATISGTGVASALAQGTSAITASLAGVTGPADTLTVIPSSVVNTTADNFGFSHGTISLRDAIAGANAVPGQTITFDPTVFASAQTITLSLGQLELSDTSGTETITGPAAGVTVRGNNTSRVFQVDSGVTATISGLTITGGKAVNGGGVYLNNGGTATLTDCTVSGNSASNNGGGLANNGGSLTLIGCAVSGNSASNNGGGLANNGGSLTLIGCAVSDNSAKDNGGGVFTDGYGTTTLTNCTVSGNTALKGGVFTNQGTTLMTSCTVSGNSARYGAGVYTTTYGTATLTNVTVSGNSASVNGGGVYSSGTTTLTDCTIRGNSASAHGGGVEATYVGNHTTTLINCTVSGNSASDGGGGFTNGGGATDLTNCTISDNSATNSGGGLCAVNGSDGTGTTTLANTIVAGNTATTSGPDTSGTFVSEGHNLIGETDGSSGWAASDLTGTIAKPLDPMLAPLGNYGGPTQTMALLPGSPALGAGTAVSGITTDQRGQPVDFPFPDIGAYQDRPRPYIVATADGQLQGWLGGARRTRPSASMSSPAPPTTPTGPARNRTSSAR